MRLPGRSHFGAAQGQDVSSHGGALLAMSICDRAQQDAYRFLVAADGDATQLSVGSAAATAYAVRPASGGLNVVVVNKETQNLTLAIETNQIIRTATLQIMTGPGLAATSGVTIRGATLNRDGSFAPAKPGNLSLTGTQTTCSIPPLSAGLISIT
jgi:hypothetical protein